MTPTPKFFEPSDKLKMQDLLLDPEKACDEIQKNLEEELE